MTVQSALRAALRDLVAPAARVHGYRGSAPNWRKVNAAGDWAVVHVQSSSSSTAESLRCVVDLAVVPEPWLAWCGRKWRLPKAVDVTLGLYRLRLHPTGTPPDTDGWWRVDDPRQAPAAVADMVRRLDRDGWPVLDRLLDRAHLLERIRAGDLGGRKRRGDDDVPFDRAEAVLVADHGPGDELDALLRRVSDRALPEHHEHDERFVTFVRERAARASG